MGAATDLGEVGTVDRGDQKALRAILASAASEDTSTGIDGPRIDIISVVTEDDTYKQDVVELSDPATLEDHERVPVLPFATTHPR